MKTNNWPKADLNRNIPAVIDVLMGSSCKDAGEKINVSCSRMSQLVHKTLRNTFLWDVRNNGYQNHPERTNMGSLRKYSEHWCKLLQKYLDTYNEN